MGSRSAAKSSRSKAVSAAGANKPTKSGNINNKQCRNDESEELDDLSVLRKSVGTSVNGLGHALKVFQSGTQEVRSLLSQECKVIYECRVCENLFRSLANFLSHKRIYCRAVASASRPTGSAPSQPNGLVPQIGQPASGSEIPSDGSLEMVIVQPEPPVKRHRSESPDHWICNESTPYPDTDIVDPLPKLECSVPPIRRRKDICGVIEKLSKRASRQNLANATAVASHLASLSGRKFCLDNAVSTTTSNTLYMENISETKNAVYQTLLCKTSSSMKLSHPSSNSEHSKMLAHIGLGATCSEITTKDTLAMAGSLPNLPIVSDRLSDLNSAYDESQCSPIPPVPHELLLKKRVSHLKEVISQNERAVLGPDGIVIPPKANGPAFPPEVCSGGVSNSEGEEVDDEEEGDDSSPTSKGKSKEDFSKDLSPEEKEEIICSICKARFSTRKTLNHHMKSLHVMFRTYFRCPCCKNCFANNWSVYRHLYKVHRKTTDQVRKLRALIKKKAFRKKILLPLPTSLAQPSSIPSNSDHLNDDLSKPELPAVSVKTSPSSSGKQFSSSSTSVGRMPSGPGRSGSPLPPPSEATQFPAISAQHAQVLRKLENIVKQEDNHWRFESFPECPGMGQSCPGCNRRFERRAALASHAHSCHKRILLAAQKASRARNKQQQQKTSKTGSGGKGGMGAEESEKGLPESKDNAVKVMAPLTNGKRCEAGIKLETHESAIVDSGQSGLVKTYGDDEKQNDLTLNVGVKSQSLNSISQKSVTELGFILSTGVTGTSKLSPDLLTEKLKDEEWEEIERPNSASSFGTHQDSSSPLTVPSQPGRQQRIGIQIRKDYVKGDRGSACSSGTSPTPYSTPQISKLDEEADEEIVILSRPYSKNPAEMSPNSSKQSASACAEICSDLEESNNSRPLFNSGDKNKHVIEKKELILQLEDILSRKKSTDSDSTFHNEDNNSLDEQIVCSGEKEEPTDDFFEKPQMEGVVGSHGEVKRVFLEVIVGGVADPNSLTVDEEENERLAEEKGCGSKMDKKEFRGTSSRRTAAVRSKVPSSSLAVQRQGGRPVRNRVKVEREDFIYDLSDMRLSPAKRDDLNSVSSHGLTSLKRPRRNTQQQFLGNISHGMSNSSVEGSSSVKQALAPGMIKIEGSNKPQSSSALPPNGGPTLRVYAGKGSGCSLSTSSSNKVPISTSSSANPTSAGSHKLSDCRVVIGGLRSGDMTQLSVRRVYGSRKVLSPSNTTPVAVEHEDVVSLNSLRKYGRNKECALSLSDVDEGLFGEMGRGDISTPEKQTGKSSLLYQSDSLDSTDSLSDCSGVAQRKHPVGLGEMKPKT